MSIVEIEHILSANTSANLWCFIFLCKKKTYHQYVASKKGSYLSGRCLYTSYFYLIVTLLRDIFIFDLFAIKQMKWPDQVIFNCYGATNITLALQSVETFLKVNSYLSSWPSYLIIWDLILQATFTFVPSSENCEEILFFKF